MPYRDDRDALLERVAQLETELRDARSDVERLTLKNAKVMGVLRMLAESRRIADALASVNEID